MRVLKMLGGAVVLTAMLTPVVSAQDVADVRRLTILTFSAPVQLPGVTLPAGKYRFEMADIQNAPHVVRVLSEDGMKVLGTFSTIPTTMATRDLRDTDTLVMWAERPAGQPQAAKEWYYPQRSTGEEFVYPKEQAMAIAAANNASVPSEDDGKIVRIEGTGAAATETPETAAATTTTETPQAQVAQTETRETEVAQNTTPAPVPERAPEAVATSGQRDSQAVGTSGQSPAASQTQAADPAPAPRTLPRTASQLGLFGLLSVLLIAAALGIRQLRLRVSPRG